MSQRSAAKRLWYWFLRIACRLIGVTVFGIRCYGREHVPSSGGALILSNHQSHMDPVLVGLACDRRLNYLARSTLYGFRPLAWLIETLDAIPIDREGMGLGGLKETLRRVKRGEIVLLFPEGTRTRDGEIASLKPGFCALSRRVDAPLVPVAIDGAFDCWRRGRPFPKPGQITLQFGRPITPAEIARLDDAQLVSLVEARMHECLEMSRERRCAH